MKHNLKNCFLIFLASIYTLNLKAGKEYGGYATYAFLEKGKFEITFFVYTGCANKLLSDTSHLKVWIGVNGLYYDLHANYAYDIKNPIQCNNPCGGTPMYDTRVFKSVLNLNKHPYDTFVKMGCEVEINAYSASDIGTLSNISSTNSLMAFGVRINYCNIKQIGFKSPQCSQNLSHRFSDVISYNQESYPTKGDSLYFEFKCITIDSAGKCAKYNNGFNYYYPYSCNCSNGSNNCTPNPKTYPPNGFYINHLTGDILFQSTKISEFSALSIKVQQFHMDSSGKSVFCGYTVHTFAKSTESNGNETPYFSIPDKIEICEGDSTEILITPSDNDSYDSLSFVFSGNLPRYYYSLSGGYYRPTCKIKFRFAPGENNEMPYVFTIKVLDRFGSCVMKSIASKSIAIYCHKKIESIIHCSKGICNSINCNAQDKYPELKVTHSWSVYKDNWNTKAIYTYQGDNFNLNALTKAKYLIKCVVTTPNAYCTQRTYKDSVDLISTWPGLDFKITPPYFCPFDSAQKYKTAAVTGFAAGFKSLWKLDTIVQNKDTFKYNIFSDKTISLNVSDTAGCVLTKIFTITKDSIAFLDFMHDTAICKTGNLALGLLNPAKPWLGSWNLILNKKDTVHLGKLLTLNYKYSKPINQVIVQYNSDWNCQHTFSTIVRVDTTQIAVDKTPEFCSGVHILALNSIKHKPDGGNWSSSKSTANTIRVDTFTLYPAHFYAYYQITNSATNCTFKDTSNVKIGDTNRAYDFTTFRVCSELKNLDAFEYFKPLNTDGIWICTNANLKLTSAGKIDLSASKPGTYVIVYRRNGGLCPEEIVFIFTIKKPLILLQASCDITSGKTPLLVQFTGTNKVTPDTGTKSLWQFNDPSSGKKDTSTLNNPQHTFATAGAYKPMLTGDKQGCLDTFLLPTINVQFNSVAGFSNKTEIELYPNPVADLLTVSLPLLVDGKDKELVIYSADGKLIQKLSFIKNTVVLDVSSFSTGLYLLKIMEAGQVIGIKRFSKF